MNGIRIAGIDAALSPIALGTADFGSTVDEEMSFRIMDAYVDRGGNVIDTASVYANWLPGETSISEKTIGRWLKRRGGAHGVVVATKGAHPPLDAMQKSRLSKEDIAEDLEMSLRHLVVDCIDLYWLHRDDRSRPVADILESLNEHVRAGRIRSFGCSNWQPDRIAEAQAYARERGLKTFAGSQIYWNMAVLNPGSIQDRTLVRMDEAGYSYYRDTAGMTVFAYTSQAQGVFAKLAEAGEENLKEGVKRHFLNDGTRSRLERAGRIAAKYGTTVGAVALAFLTSQPFPTIPIVGCRSLEQLERSLEAADVRLTPEDVAYVTDGAGSWQMTLSE